ncbi:hypothetical protein N0V93_008857 [Gnomoniopsis smithogilvyi]|uniref:FAD-binding FR-type domain-containing protein n=1 Tax=Gnomoniopsis smithogilvyi TaxID=1191159 RepID=A0A9W8YK14_9PEZI|nr:hypothetical protein N0V93_008857 [Gnomoniopsis smithogilvyi]
MLYTGIFWASILAILLLWGVGRRVSPSQPALEQLISRADSEVRESREFGGVRKLKGTLSSLRRRFFLQDFSPRLLGHVTRLQVTILLILAAYLLVLSFIGISYKTWITPVSKSPGLYNTRTSLGPFADRIGVLAYALTPLSILLASRESLLSLLTGVPYQSFMFLHRWTGYIILVQSSVHTLGWVIVEAKLYQPQPSTWYSLVGELYIQWGFVALAVLVLLWVLATPLGIKLTGYEMFRKVHYCLAMVYIGAIIGHWEQLQCFLIPGMLLWFFDRLGRAIRTGMLHYQWLPTKGKWGFEAAHARVVHWEDERNGDVIRLDFEHIQQPWELGQHFFLCFTEGSIWQSHPMTPLSLPMADKSGRVRHSYVIRAKSGETKKIAGIAARKLAALGNAPSLGEDKTTAGAEVTTPVILTGPYGIDIVGSLTPQTNVLCIAGGTGITFVLPVLLKLVRERRVSSRRIGLVWAIRRDVDVKWVEAELNEIKETGCSHGVKVDVYVTREKNHTSISSASSDAGGCDCKDAGHHHPSNVEAPEARRPRLDEIVKEFLSSVLRGPSTVYASGPGGLIGDLRTAVAASNKARKVWRGDDRGDVRLVCDDRLE